MPTIREEEFELERNGKAMKIEMEFHDECRDQVAIKMVKYQQLVKAYHDAQVQPKYFQVRDQVI